MTETVRDTGAERPDWEQRKPAEALVVGDFLAAGELAATPVEIRLADTHMNPEMMCGRETVIAYRIFGDDRTYVTSSGANIWYGLATDAELAEAREGGRRTEVIAGIRAMVDWLEANPSVPMPYFSVQVSPGAETLSDLDVWNSGAQGLAEVHRLAEIMGAEIVTHKDHADVTKTFRGRVEYRVVAWHKDGRPVEPAPVDATGADEDLGVDFARSQTADPDETPVPTSRRYQPHAGSVLSGIGANGTRLGEPSIDPDSSMEAHYDAETDRPATP